MKTSHALACCLALLAVPATAQSAARPAGTAKFVDANGKANGTARLTETPKGVLIEAEISGLAPSQWVAFHIHETGRCDASTAHNSAGGHFNPGNAQHGYLAGNGPHAGDMPNQYVGADGVLRIQAFNPMVRLDGGATAIRGRALMVHAGKDDYQTQPTGDAGARQSCGVIE